MWRTAMNRFGAGNWIFLVACLNLFTFTRGGGEVRALALAAEPADAVAAAGERVLLACAAAAPARLAWRFSAAAAPTRDHALPATDAARLQLANGSLVIDSMSAALAGHYQCVATVDGVGTLLSRVATLFLAEVPEVADAAEGARVVVGVEGAAALLPCRLRTPPRLAVRVLPAPHRDTRVYGAVRPPSPPPLLRVNVTWLKNGSPVAVDGGRVALLPSGALELEPVRAHDAAAYRCRVTLPADPARASLGPELHLRVDAAPAQETPPRFVATPQPVTVVEGASATFDCAAVGNPKPEMVWLNNGVAIDLNDLDSRFYLVGSGSLRVQSARALDAGAYTCRATNRLDSADHSTHLAVMTAPRVYVRDSEVRARARGDVTLRCDARGRPQPHVAWLKDGEPLTPNSHDITLVDGASLRIQGLLDVDAGVFQCTATSPAGNAAAALRLLVAPPAPAETVASDSVEPGEPAEEGSWLGETSSAYTAAPRDDYDDTLTDNDDYFFHAAEDWEGLPENASVVAPPRNFRAVIVKHRFVTLSWEEPARGAEEVTGYVVLYRVKGSERERVARGGLRHELNVGSLQPNTTYELSARTLSRSAASPPTDTVEVHTPEEEAAWGPPADVRVEPAGPHELRVTWSPPASAPAPAAAAALPAAPTKYAVYYTEVESNREQSIFVEQSPATITGLRAAAQYVVRVAAVGGVPSAERNARTQADAPAAPPGNVTATPTGDTSLLVRWEAPPAKSLRGALTGYKVRYRAAPPSRRRAGSLTTPADVRRAEIRDLEPAATYQIRVCAINANGSGPFSEWVTAATQARRRAEAAVPDAPPPLTTRAGRDWISVWWGEGGGGALVRGYALGWGLGVPDEHARDLPAHAHSYVIRGLASNAEYVISLRASNALGLGPAVYATVRTRAPPDLADPDDDGPDEPDDPEDPDDDPDDDDTPPLIPPVGLKVIMLSGTTAVVYWTDPTLPKGQAATDGRRYVVRWAAAGGRPRVYNATDLNCMLDDLRPHTTYEFAVKLIKGGRESAWSMLASNTTLEAAPASAPRDLRAAPAQPAARAVDLTWMPPARPNGVITGYVLMYAVQRGGGAGGGGGAEEWVAVGVAGERGRARLDRLRPRTTYAFKIQARNSKGLGPFSAPLLYTTGPGGEGGGLAGATSAWLWASAGGACAVLALAAALALSLCCRRPRATLDPDTSTYQKASASAGIKPPDLWIHHDQMELKHMDKSLHSSAMSAGSVEGGGLVSSTLTLARAPPAEYEPARHAPLAPHLASLDRRYVPTYVAMTGMGVGVGVGCTATCDRRRHLPDQSTPLLGGMAGGGAGSPQSSLASLHAPPPAPCEYGPASRGTLARPHSPRSCVAGGAGACPLGAACAAAGGGSELYATASTARERGHYVAYEPLGHYTHRDSLSSEAGGGGAGGAGAGGGSLQRRGACGPPMHSFALPDDDHSTPSHSKPSSVRDTSPYKKSASSSPGRLLGGGGAAGGAAGELEPLTPSRSTERLHREMQNLEGLMKDLSAITQQQFHC
ncbi:neogenin [Aricia agestis]|uniref:neogenin n=1 Tax=Aricia agestis TaxID=91739 RepID=UPI001C20A7C0|nr:neogenin [Aricia agestis]